jgi:hypothetical protein
MLNFFVLALISFIIKLYILLVIDIQCERNMF